MKSALIGMEHGQRDALRAYSPLHERHAVGRPRQRVIVNPRTDVNPRPGKHQIDARFRSRAGLSATLFQRGLVAGVALIDAVNEDNRRLKSWPWSCGRISHLAPHVVSKPTSQGGAPAELHYSFHATQYMDIRDLSQLWTPGALTYKGLVISRL